MSLLAPLALNKGREFLDKGAFSLHQSLSSEAEPSAFWRLSLRAATAGTGGALMWWGAIVECPGINSNMQHAVRGLATALAQKEESLRKNMGRLLRFHDPGGEGGEFSKEGARRGHRSSGRKISGKPRIFFEARGNNASDSLKTACQCWNILMK